MKKIIIALMVLFCGTMITSCTNIDTQKNTGSDVKTVELEIPYTEVTVPQEAVEVGFYYNTLSDEKKLIYGELLSGMLNHEEAIVTHTNDTDEVFEIFQFVLADRPDIFWCDGKVDMTLHTQDDISYLDFAIRYNYTKEECVEKQAIIDREAESALQGISGGNTEYEKIFYVYNYIVNNVDYDINAVDSQNIVSVFENKVSVCAGYSKAMQYLLQKLGVFCTYVTGESKGEAHGWNLVSCDGVYYYVDVTWGDPVFSEDSDTPDDSNYISYDYMCCSTEALERTHTIDYKELMPACNSMDANYYVRSGMYYTSYDQDAVMAALNSSVSNKISIATFKFSDNESYNAAAQDMIDNKIPEAAGNLAAWYDLDETWYHYIDDEELTKITVFWQFPE